MSLWQMDAFRKYYQDGWQTIGANYRDPMIMPIGGPIIMARDGENIKIYAGKVVKMEDGEEC